MVEQYSPYGFGKFRPYERTRKKITDTTLPFSMRAQQMGGELPLRESSPSFEAPPTADTFRRSVGRQLPNLNLSGDMFSSQSYAMPSILGGMRTVSFRQDRPNPATELMFQREAGQRLERDQILSSYAQQNSGSYSSGTLPQGEGVLKWANLYNTVSEEIGVPPDVLAAIVHIETGGTGNANATGPMTSYDVSARGLMQVMPNWFQGMANEYDGDLYNPETNVRVGARILKGHYDTYGDWELAARAYFAGPGGMYDDQRTDKTKTTAGTSVAQYARLFNEHRQTYASQMQAPQRSGNGEYSFPVDGYSGELSLHWGVEEGTGAIDLFAPEGTPVRAIRGGTASSGYSDIGGYWTMITGNDGLQYYYAHMDGMGPNGTVNTGDVLAGVSDTGNAKGTGPHLHLGIGNTIYSGTGPRGGAGDINVIEFLRGNVGYGAPLQGQGGHEGHAHVNPGDMSAWGVFGGDQFSITQEFGNTSFAQSSGWYGDAGHTGVDIGVPQGTGLHTPVSGTVTHAGLNGGYGGTVTIQTSFGSLMLTHLSDIGVQVGQQIDAGSFIGRSGGASGTWGAGSSTGPHLHFEVRDQNGNVVNPYDVFDF